MMKNLYLAVVCVCLTAVSKAQLRVALTGGPHSASVKEQNKLPSWETSIKPGYSSRSGLHLGIIGEMPLSISSSARWFFQPGFQYMSKGRKFYAYNDSLNSVVSDTISASQNLEVNYIDLPLNIAYKLPLGNKARLVLSAGPYISFFYNGKQHFETRLYSSNSFKNEEINLEPGTSEGKVKTFDAGFNTRVGIEMGNMMISGFLSQGLTSFYTASYDGTFRHRVRGVSLSIWLNKIKYPPKPPEPPKDTDADGIVDTADACPQAPGRAGMRGCPDLDRDRIADHLDACPDRPGTLKYKGCPVPDTDSDGLNDENDACPLVSGVLPFEGCPIPDFDEDGISDLDDLCPEEKGDELNRGCPEGIEDAVTVDTILQEIEARITYAAKNIFFEPYSNKLAAGSFAPMDEIAALLRANATYKLVIEGHTDSSGQAVLNKKLSQQRAESVKKYLIRKGINSSRLHALGYGSERPLAPNATAEGRAVNRRVELRLEN